MDTVMRILFTLAFAGLGLMLLVVGVREHFAQRSALNAIAQGRILKLPATITHAQVDSSTSMDTNRPQITGVGANTSTTSYTPSIRYSFTLSGVELHGTSIHPTIIQRGYGDRDSAAQAISDYPVGARVTAYVDPDRPDRAFLVPLDTNRPLIFMLVGLVALAAGAAAAKWL